MQIKQFEKHINGGHQTKKIDILSNGGTLNRKCYVYFLGNAIVYIIKKLLRNFFLGNVGRIKKE